MAIQSLFAQQVSIALLLSDEPIESTLYIRAIRAVLRMGMVRAEKAQKSQAGESDVNLCACFAATATATGIETVTFPRAAGTLMVRKPLESGGHGLFGFAASSVLLDEFLPLLSGPLRKKRFRRFGFRGKAQTAEVDGRAGVCRLFARYDR